MRALLLLALLIGASLFSIPRAVAQSADGQTPREFASQPCATAPTLDGKQDPGEWSAAAHYPVTLTMVSAGQPTTATVQADLWLMNSASQLFLALRVPDSTRQASLQPLLFDLVVLQFCRGEALAAGDDKKMIVPGMYADKHFVAPGQDADDKVKNGKGVMTYSGQGADGAYFVELGMPLNSGDGEDLAAAPGQSVKFNLVYADGFQADLTKIHIGGLFGPDLDHATKWGTMKLAAITAEAAPPAPPAWVEALFPYTGKPDEFAHRLQRTEVVPLDVDGQAGSQVTCQFIYPEIDDSIETGTVIFFLPPVLATQPGKRVPLLHQAGYEIDAGGVMGYLKEGIAVATVHAHPLNPLARGPKLDWAMLHAERRLPFVDDARVFIQGGSAGGYMTLMTAAETFPVVCAMPMVPPVNWAYNGSYIIKNKPLAFSHRAGSDQPALPVVCIVTGILDQAEARFGSDEAAPAMFNLSPVRLIDGITAPVLAVFSTADMLVPVNQVGSEFIHPINKADFPEGFTNDIDAVLAKPEQRLRLLDVVTTGSREIFKLAVPAGAGKMKSDGTADGENKPLDLPFSRTRQWSIAVIDEGAPEPQDGHFKYAMNPDYTPYWHWALGEGVQAGQLTPGKLTLLMKRYQGVQPLDFMVNPANKPAHKAQMLDFPKAERADVLRGLITFARNDAAALRLAEVYAALPADLKPWGAALGADTPESIRQALDQAAAAQAK